MKCLAFTELLLLFRFVYLLIFEFNCIIAIFYFGLQTSRFNPKMVNFDIQCFFLFGAENAINEDMDTAKETENTR